MESDWGDMEDIARQFKLIGFRNVMFGRLPNLLAPLQTAHFRALGMKRNGDTWVKQLGVRLLQLLHNQWIYRCAYTHQRAEDGLKKAERKELREEMLINFNMGSDLLLDEEKFLLDNNWATLWKLNGAEKRAWLQAIKSARRIATNARRGRRRHLGGGPIPY